MTTADDLKRANQEGRQANPGSPNPYAGASPGLARSWRLGYHSMLLAMLEASPAVERYRDGMQQFNDET